MPLCRASEGVSVGRLKQPGLAWRPLTVLTDSRFPPLCAELGQSRLGGGHSALGLSTLRDIGRGQFLIRLRLRERKAW